MSAGESLYNQAAPTAAASTRGAFDSGPPTRGQGQELELDHIDVEYALWLLKCIRKLMKVDDNDADLRDLEEYLLNLAIDVLEGAIEW